MENKTLVIYKSKTGFTQRYAQWISRELNCEAVPYKDRKKLRLKDYQTVIYGGGFFGGSIRGLKWLLEQMPAAGEKRWVVFATGATPPESPDVEKALKQNFTDLQWAKVKAFYLHGGLCYEKMGPIDKLMMAMFKKMLKKSGETEALKNVQSSYDSSSKDYIKPLTDYCAAPFNL